MELAKSEYAIDRILDRRIKEGRVEYYVKWKGYSIEQSTWEPLHNLRGALKTLLRFEKTARNTAQRRRKRRAELSGKLGRPKNSGYDRGLNKQEVKKLSIFGDDIETILIDSDDDIHNKNESFYLGSQCQEMNFAASIQVSEDVTEKILMSFHAEQKVERGMILEHLSEENILPTPDPAGSQKLDPLPSEELYVAKYKDGREVTMTKEELLRKHPRKFEMLTKNEGKRE